MYSNRALLLIAAAVTLSLLTTSTAPTTPAMASSKGGGSVVQEQVNTGNTGLDKEINKFYNCISKTHQDPPSINKVDNCYSQAFGGSYSGVSTTNSGITPISTSTSSIHHHKHGNSASHSGVTGTGTGTLILPTSTSTSQHHKKG
jgi:hypothetical protein